MIPLYVDTRRALSYTVGMRIFVSHAWKDEELARRLREHLVHTGLSVWDPEEEIAPGDNWAKKTGKALADSDFMVVLLTPGAMKDGQVRQNIDFMLASRKYEGRVFTVFVGPTLEAGKDMPWILLRFPHRQVGSAREFGKVAKEVQGMDAQPSLSHSHA